MVRHRVPRQGDDRRRDTLCSQRGASFAMAWPRQQPAEQATLMKGRRSGEAEGVAGHGAAWW